MNMKKVTSLMFIMLLIGSSYGAFAQAQFALGIKGGPNFAKINGDASPGENYKNRTGFHAGAFALIKLTKFGIQPEILFSQQGSTLKIDGGGSLDQNVSYINIPVILKLYTVAGINLQVGPQVGFVSKAKSESFVNGISGAKTTTDIKNQLKGNDFSLALGAGWDLPFGLTIDARYNLGLSKITKDSGSGSSDAKNQVFQVSVGFKLIKIGK
jgi:hypothetical protein